MPCHAVLSWGDCIPTKRFFPEIPPVCSLSQEWHISPDTTSPAWSRCCFIYPVYGLPIPQPLGPDSVRAKPCDVIHVRVVSNSSKRVGLWTSMELVHRRGSPQGQHSTVSGPRWLAANGRWAKWFTDFAHYLWSSANFASPSLGIDRALTPTGSDGLDGLSLD